MKTKIDITPTWRAIASEIEYNSMKRGRAHAEWKNYLYDMAKVADICVALSKDPEIQAKIDNLSE